MLSRPSRRRTLFGRGDVPIERLDDVVSPIFQSPWDYVPAPPYRVQWWHETLDLELVHWEHWLKLEAAVARFIDQAIPPTLGQYAFVMDESSRVVFGYNNSTFSRETFKATAWYGMEIGFQLAAADGRIDPLELTMWEATAMASIPDA